MISLRNWDFWDEGPYCPCSSGLTGGTGLEDHGQCAHFYFILFLLPFVLLLFIDRFIVLSFGMGLDIKQGWLNVKERRLNEKLKYINNCSVNLSMSYYIDEHHEIYVYWKNNSYLCLCFVCLQQCADVILTAVELIWSV